MDRTESRTRLEEKGVMSEVGDGAPIAIKSQMQVRPGLEALFCHLSAGSGLLCAVVQDAHCTREQVRAKTQLAL